MTAAQVKQLKKVFIMAAGTGGHVFPGLAIAYHLHSQGIKVYWLGTPYGMEAKWLPEFIEFHPIAVKGLRGKGMLSLLSSPLKLCYAMWQAWCILRRIKPDVVIGMGGFVSGPGGLVAWMLGYPLVIHEQNTIAGMTNRLLAPFAKRILLGFPGAFKQKPKVMILGNPIRQEIYAVSALACDKRQDKAWHLLVLGGSLGAQAINQVMPLALSLLPATDRPYIIHQTGEKHLVTTLAAYAAQGIVPSERLRILPFIDSMDEVYAKVDLALCRAGALTVSELCSVGLGAIFIPYPYAVDDHQTTNAAYMVREGAALCIPQAELTPECLADLLAEFTRHPEKRRIMAESAYALRQDQVVEKIVAVLHDVVAARVDL